MPTRVARREGEVHGATVPGGRAARSCVQGVESKIYYSPRDKDSLYNNLQCLMMMIKDDGLVRLVAVQCFLREGCETED